MQGVRGRSDRPRTSNPRWSVIFDGHTARLVRTHEVRTRRWWQWQSTIRTVDQVVGIYQCRMGLELKRKLNRPDDLTLTLDGAKLKLQELRSWSETARYDDDDPIGVE
jgi:hypothetical protein